MLKLTLAVCFYWYYQMKRLINKLKQFNQKHPAKNQRQEKRRKTFFEILEDLPGFFQWTLFIFMMLCAIFVSTNNPADLYTSYRINTTKNKTEKEKLRKEQQLSQAKQNILNQQAYTLNSLKNKQGYLTLNQVDKYGNANRLYIVTDTKTGVEYFYQNPNISGKTSGGDIVMHERIDNNNKPIINSSWQAEQNNKLSVNQKLTLTKLISDAKIQGNVTIMKNGHIVFDKNISQPNNSAYLINSLQKSITAITILQSIQKHKLKLSDKLSKFYPNIAGSNNITIADMLNMQSGLSCSITEANNLTGKNQDAVIQKLTPFIQYNSYEQGKSKYNSINYVLLASILSKVEHKSYNTLFKDKIVKPLKLNQTTFDYHNKRVIAGHSFNNKTNTFNKVKYNKVQIDNMVGAGNVYMSNKDLLSVINAEINGKLLKSQMQNQFNSIVNVDYHDGYWIKNKQREANGNGKGYNNVLRISPDNKTIVLIQSNVNNQSDEMKKLANNLLKVATNIDASELNSAVTSASDLK